LPAAIVKLCAEDSHIADPGQNWNATDSIMDPTLPGKRLIWGAIGGEYYVVHYERGGIAHTFHILVARLMKNDAKPKVVWTGVGGPLKDYAAFLDALRSGKLDDRLDASGLATNDAISCLKKRINCEAFCSVRISSRDALSEIKSRRLAGTDFLFVFRNTDCERVAVPAKLRLAIQSYLQFALAAG
jgi:hypothetical protein